ncbi:phosphonate C-P lyase system protein PhnG [Rhizobium miluonense]|uniref:Alpha-D-ribose 1-methylphosphonate 5-triphosphate synthase subunit PhnG n=1 Tax=Rhizobium miluonense TaxID=411945 RepID=A0A1C3WEW6_9HYPH|nr:phosphonate C-P lyase system protein PhnG [Rhizobium miluonense]SCB38244.1 alpha-D-ribose 1-methylphosphonate 5-triphosphate synthase subunit PhnG [Rhizobium miluonense]
MTIQTNKTELSAADGNTPVYDRAAWLTFLAEALPEELEAQWAAIPHPAFIWLRRPELGSAMIRARAGGTGMQFNLGDVTVTRCTLQLATGEIGVGYVMGRNKRHAALAALFDALLLKEQGEGSDTIFAFIARLERSKAKRKAAVTAETLSSKVDFTMLAREGVQL